MSWIGFFFAQQSLIQGPQHLTGLLCVALQKHAGLRHGIHRDTVELLGQQRQRDLNQAGGQPNARGYCRQQTTPGTRKGRIHLDRPPFSTRVICSEQSSVASVWPASQRLKPSVSCSSRRRSSLTCVRIMHFHWSREMKQWNYGLILRHSQRQKQTLPREFRAIYCARRCSICPDLLNRATKRYSGAGPYRAAPSRRWIGPSGEPSRWTSRRIRVVAFRPGCTSYGTAEVTTTGGLPYATKSSVVTAWPSWRLRRDPSHAENRQAPAVGAAYRTTSAGSFHTLVGIEIRKFPYRNPAG